jgi:hypothetical protein
VQSPSLVGTTVSGPLDDLGTLVGTTFNVQNEAGFGRNDETLRVESVKNIELKSFLSRRTCPTSILT